MSRAAALRARATIAAMSRRVPAGGSPRTRNESSLWYAYGTVRRPQGGLLSASAATP